MTQVLQKEQKRQKWRMGKHPRGVPEEVEEVVARRGGRGEGEVVGEVVQAQAAVDGEGLAVAEVEVLGEEEVQRLVQDLELEGNSFLLRPPRQAVAHFLVARVQLRRGGQRGRRHRQAHGRGRCGVHAVRQRVQQRRPLHAVRGAHVHDVHARRALHGVQDGAVRRHVPEPVERRHVHQVRQLVETQLPLRPLHLCSQDPNS